ncbi:MAG: hypothetical protein AB9872_09650 [Solidesulfovibrio sp.]
MKAMGNARRPLRDAAWCYLVAALPYAALLADVMTPFYVAAIASPLLWLAFFVPAYRASGHSRRTFWLLAPAALLSIAPLGATAALFSIWGVYGFGS